MRILIQDADHEPMRGFRIRRIESEDDLIGTPFEELLNYYDIEELVGFYIKESRVLYAFIPVRTKTVDFITYDEEGRVQFTKVDAYLAEDGHFYVTI